MRLLHEHEPREWQVEAVLLEKDHIAIVVKQVCLQLLKKFGIGVGVEFLQLIAMNASWEITQFSWGLFGRRRRHLEEGLGGEDSSRHLKSVSNALSFRKRPTSLLSRVLMSRGYPTNILFLIPRAPGDLAHTDTFFRIYKQTFSITFDFSVSET